MRNRSRFLQLLMRCSPPVLGVLAVAVLYAGLFALDFAYGADLRVFGVSDAATQQMVFSRYGAMIVRHQLRLLLVFVGLGLGIGTVLQLLIMLWESTGSWPKWHHQSSAETPLRLPPTPWPLSRRLLVSVGAGLLLHLYLMTRGIEQRPSLYSETLYDHGGILQSLMLQLTNGPSRWLIPTGAAIALLFLLLGPILSARGRRAVADLWLSRRRALLVGLTLVVVSVGVLVLINRPSTAPATATNAPRSSAQPPSILLIAVDSLRADRIYDDSRGRRVAPAIFDLAQRSVRFESAHVSVPRTFPSFVTLLTARYPHRHGIRTMFPSLKERSQVPVALPQLLQDAGYQTAVLSDFCGEIFSRINLGFQSVQVPPFDAKTIVLQRSLTVHKNLLPYITGTILGPANLRLGQRVFPELRALAELSDPQLLASRAKEQLQQFKQQGAPFFMTVFFSTAHFPYAAQGPYYRRFTDPKYRGPFRYHKPPLLEGTTPADIAQAQALYDGAVAASDAGVNTLLTGLRELGLADNTIVVLLADHGENLYDEAGRGMGHGDHLEGDASLRVPLLIYDPVHKFAPHAVPGLVRDLDVVPTLLQLAGVQNKPADTARLQLDGTSLMPLLTGQKSTLDLRSLAETELWFTAAGPGFADDQRLPYPDVTATTDIAPDDDIAVAERYRELVTVAKHRALRTDRYKLIYRPTRQGPRYSLFDVQTDPRELHDLSSEQPTLLAQLQGELFKLLSSDPSVEVQSGFILPR